MPKANWRFPAARIERAPLMREPVCTFCATFSDTGEWAAKHRAEAWLVEHGFSVGRQQGSAPRGILFGLYDIQKWRNLSEADRAELHGILHGDMRDGPVIIEIFATAPEAALRAFRQFITITQNSCCCEAKEHS